MDGVVKAVAFGLMAAAISTARPTAAQSVADFYKGKQIEFIAAGDPGTTQDVWSRILARHMPRHLPGAPTFVVKNIPGSGHIKAADYLFNIAAKDGTAIGTFSNSIVSGYVMKLPGITFDATKFLWLGSPDLSNRGCVAREGAAVQKAEDLFSRELIVGGTGATGGISATPTLLRGLLGMRFKLVEGYPGPGEVFLAMDRGELDGICNTLSGVEVSRPGQMAQGKLKLLLNLEPEPVPGLDAPSIYRFTKTEEERRIIAFYNSNLELGRPFFAPPGVPADRLQALRTAFAAALKDPALVEEATKAKLEIVPLSGEELTRRVDRMAATPPDIIEKTNKLLAPEASGGK